MAQHGYMVLILIIQEYSIIKQICLNHHIYRSLGKNHDDPQTLRATRQNCKSIFDLKRLNNAGFPKMFCNLENDVYII